MLELIALKARVVGLVEDRQVDLAQIDEPDIELAVADGDVAKPLANRETDALHPDAADDDA